MFIRKFVKTGIRYAAIITGGLFLTNRIISAISEKGILRVEKGRYFNWKPGMKVYYEVSGAGNTPLLLIHNASAIDSSYEWTFLKEECSKDYRIYTLDLLGCGRSDKPSSEYTNYLFALMINDFINDIIGEPSYVCATGLSGSFAATAAYLNPSNFKGIAMISPASLQELQKTVQEEAPSLRLLYSLPVIGTTFYHMAITRSAVEYSLKEQYFFNPFLVQQSTVDAMYEASHKDNGKGKYFLASIKGGYLYWNISSFLPKLDIPILVMNGEKTAGAEEIAKEYLSLGGNIKTVIVPKTKLVPQLEDPKTVSSLLKEHFS